MKQTINIDLARIKEISLKGIRRTAVFMGFGVNAAQSKDFRNYQLSNDTPFRFVPEDIDDNQIDNFKEHFEHWIICCGLRELIETFSVYLNAIFKACLLAAIHKKKIEIENPDKRLESFKWKGVERQLKTLRNQFGVETTKEIYIRTINQVRNCLTHRRGVVGSEDLRGENSLKLCWWALDPFIETPSGEIISMAPPFPKEGRVLKDGGMFCVKVIEKEREFRIREVIKISPNDLSEICMLITIATDEISKSSFDFLKTTGIEIIETEPTG